MSILHEQIGNGRDSPGILRYSREVTIRHNPPPENLDKILQRLMDSLAHIIRTFDCRESPGYFPVAIDLLKSLPLTTAEFALARNRIDNAQRYADSEEPGAAVYELKILLGRLRNGS